MNITDTQEEETEFYTEGTNGEKSAEDVIEEGKKRLDEIEKEAKETIEEWGMNKR